MLPRHRLPLPHRQVFGPPLWRAVSDCYVTRVAAPFIAANPEDVEGCEAAAAAAADLEAFAESLNLTGDGAGTYGTSGRGVVHALDIVPCTEGDCSSNALTHSFVLTGPLPSRANACNTQSRTWVPRWRAWPATRCPTGRRST